jgi:hypothetical protein
MASHHAFTRVTRATDFRVGKKLDSAAEHAAAHPPQPQVGQKDVPACTGRPCRDLQPVPPHLPDRARLRLTASRHAQSINHSIGLGPRQCPASRSMCPPRVPGAGYLRAAVSLSWRRTATRALPRAALRPPAAGAGSTRCAHLAGSRTSPRSEQPILAPTPAVRNGRACR